MSREIRRVPLDWEHPLQERYLYENGERKTYSLDNDYKPCYDQTFEEAVEEWKAKFIKWESTPLEDRRPTTGIPMEYWEWDSPPDRDHYRPAFTSEADGYQLYETVSEGTPVSPIFSNKSDLYCWIRKGYGWSPLVDSLIEHGSAPTGIATQKGGLDFPFTKIREY